jgi:hypothetical protein
VPLTDNSLGQQHLQQLVPEELFQCVGIVIWSDQEVPLLVKSAIGYDDVAVRIETKKVARRDKAAA